MKMRYRVLSLVILTLIFCTGILTLVGCGKEPTEVAEYRSKSVEIPTGEDYGTHKEYTVTAYSGAAPHVRVAPGGKALVIAEHRGSEKSMYTIVGIDGSEYTGEIIPAYSVAIYDSKTDVMSPYVDVVENEVYDGTVSVSSDMGDCCLLLDGRIAGVLYKYDDRYMAENYPSKTVENSDGTKRIVYENGMTSEQVNS